MGSIHLDPASSDTKLYIWETLLKIKELLIQEPELIHGFKKEFIWMARNLGFLIDYMEDLEEQSGGLELESASQEGKRALKSFLDYEIRLANNMCNFINSFTQKRDGQFDYDFDDLSTVLKFSKEMKWIEGASSSNHGRSFQKLDLDMDEEKEEEFSQVIGLEEDVQVLSWRLIQDTQEVMFIVGVQGIGKTTLAMEVYKNIFKDYHFHLRIWVTVSQEFQAVDILRNVLKKIPGLFKTKIFLYTEESAEELAEELLRILRSVRCIVVLDDLPKPRDWTSLRRLLPMFTIGESRILVTTRSREIAATEYSNNHTIHEPRTLTDRQGWELFNAKVHVPVELEQYGREILRKCMGLPLAILAVAEILSQRTATKEQWLEVLNQVNESQKSIFHTLSASADSLPSHMKKCLSCVEVFHENYDIPTRRLIVLWVAEGLVYQERYGKVPPEHLAEKLLMEFIKQNMIQAVEWKLNGKVKTCRMNYFLRDNLLSRGKIEDLPPSVNNRGAASKPSSSTDILRIADHLNHKDKCFLHIHGIDGISKSTYRQYYRNICSFLSFDSREGPAPGEDIGRFLCGGISRKCFKMLRVLDLEGVFRPQLPDSIGALVQVRYLGLRGSYIEALPSSIGNLLNLQTLDLKHTCIRSLPYSIWKNHQLRHLYLSESYRSRIEAPPSTSSLLDMQTLWGGFVNEETKIAGGLDRLTNVRKLGLVCRLKIPQQIEIGNWVERLSHLESLRLKSIDERVRPSNLYLKSLSGLNNLSSIYLLGKLENPAIMREFPQSLTEITLSLSGLEKDPMSNLRQLPNLRILNLYSGSYTGDFLVCRSGGFPLLRVLNIWKLEGLKAWILEEGAMKILRHVEIRSCNNLRRIPDGMKHLEHCRELILTKMPCEFKARVTENQGKDWHKVAHIPSIVFKD